MWGAPDRPRRPNNRGPVAVDRGLKERKTRSQSNDLAGYAKARPGIVPDRDPLLNS